MTCWSLGFNSAWHRHEEPKTLHNISGNDITLKLECRAFCCHFCHHPYCPQRWHRGPGGQWLRWWRCPRSRRPAGLDSKWSPWWCASRSGWLPRWSCRHRPLRRGWNLEDNLKGWATNGAAPCIQCGASVCGKGFVKHYFLKDSMFALAFTAWQL